MLDQQRGAAPDGEQRGRRNNRRETWCPGGKAGWIAPAGMGSAMSGGPEDSGVSGDAPGSTGRKRALSNVGEDGADSRAFLRAGGLGQLAEGDEEEEQEGPTPQRPRRDREYPVWACNLIVF